MSGKKRGYAFDIDAWIQFHLLRLAAFHRETTKADIAVLAEIIQRYHGKFGNGWASHEHLGSMAGIHKTSVIRSKRNLERLGFITIVQAGRRGSATVYRPNFDLVAEKGSKDATETKGSYPATQTHDFGIKDATLSAEYGSMDATPSYLPDRPTRAESQIDRDDCAPATPPPTVGLVATAADGAQDGFEELWKAYSYPQRKSEARAAYIKAAPDAESHERMVAAARTWRERWAEQGKADAPRFTLAKWIEREEFECDPPAPYQQKERKAKATKPKASPANDNAKAQSEPVRIIAVEEIGNPFNDWSIRLTVDDNYFRTQTFELKVINEAGNGPDAKVYSAITDIADGYSNFLGCRLLVETQGDRIAAVKAAKPEARRVQISEADSTDRQTVSAVLEDYDGKPEGRLKLNEDRLAALCEVLGISNITDTDELLWQEFVIDERGQFVSVAEHEKDAA